MDNQDNKNFKLPENHNLNLPPQAPSQGQPASQPIPTPPTSPVTPTEVVGSQAVVVPDEKKKSNVAFFLIFLLVLIVFLAINVLIFKNLVNIFKLPFLVKATPSPKPSIVITPTIEVTPQVLPSITALPTPIDEEVTKLNKLNSSTTLEAIEQDLESTDLSSIDDSFNQVDESYNQANP